MGIAPTTALQAIPRYSLTSGGTAPQFRPTWIPRSPPTVAGPSCDHLGPFASAVAPRGERCHTKTSCMVPASYISHEMLAAALVPLRDHCARDIHRVQFPPVGRRLHLGKSQPGVVVDGRFPTATVGPDTRNSPFRLPVDFEVRAALLASLVGTRTACG
jgi:hypothetical protein